jgi:hypothetical protein
MLSQFLRFDICNISAGRAILIGSRQAPGKSVSLNKDLINDTITVGTPRLRWLQRLRASAPCSTPGIRQRPQLGIHALDRGGSNACVRVPLAQPQEYDNDRSLASTPSIAVAPTLACECPLLNPRNTTTTAAWHPRPRSRCF